MGTPATLLLSVGRTSEMRYTCYTTAKLQDSTDKSTSIQSLSEKRGMVLKQTVYSVHAICVRHILYNYTAVFTSSKLDQPILLCSFFCEAYRIAGNTLKMFDN